MARLLRCLPHLVQNLKMSVLSQPWLGQKKSSWLEAKGFAAVTFLRCWWSRRACLGVAGPQTWKLQMKGPRTTLVYWGYIRVVLGLYSGCFGVINHMDKTPITSSPTIAILHVGRDGGDYVCTGAKSRNSRFAENPNYQSMWAWCTFP